MRAKKKRKIAFCVLIIIGPRPLGGRAPGAPPPWIRQCMYLERKLVTNAFIVTIMMIIWHLRLRKLLAGLFEILMIKAAIPRFIIPMRMSIRIRVRKILMRTPYSAFQYPSNVPAYFLPYFKEVRPIKMIKACPKKSMCHFQKLEMILK